MALITCWCMFLSESGAYLCEVDDHRQLVDFPAVGHFTGTHDGSDAKLSLHQAKGQLIVPGEVIFI